MQKLIFLSLTILCLILPSPLNAQNASANQKSNSEQQADPLADSRIKELIETLESQSARDEFIKNLKTLVEARQEQSEEVGSAGYQLSKTLGIEDQTQTLIQRYEFFLKENNLNGSMVGKLLLTAAAIFIVLIAMYIVRKASYSFCHQLEKLGRKFDLQHDRFGLYTRILKYIGYALIFGLFLYSLAIIWGLKLSGVIASDFSILFFSTSLNLIVISLIAIAMWETLNGVLEHSMGNASGRRANRLRTLLPVARNIVFVAFIVLFGFVILSELGIDIVPLLAGAGIAGIAIGFGAQTMVSDFINGFTVIFEDLFQVGDVVKIGDRIGKVEKITIRKVQMRDFAGIVYTIPFSEVKIVENWTKDYSYYMMDIGIAYRENTDEVIGYLKEIDDDLRNDEHYKDLILEPLDIMGVDAFADSAVIIKARLKTQPVKQWEVGREFNRRMKIKFDEKGVEIPFPHQTIYFGEDKDGSAPAAPILLKEQANNT